ncbi:MAG: carbohydrate kinase family protein [Acidimicrobiales bacterium]
MTGRRPLLLTVGDVIDETVVRLSGPLALATDTPAAITACPGGSGANQAAWAAWLGAPVRFVGRVGEADLDRHARALAAVGVEPRLAADACRSTGAIVVLVDAGGERHMLTDRGANLGLSAGDLGEGLLDGVGLLHVSGYSLFEPGPRSVLMDLMSRAGRLGIEVSVDPASSHYLGAVGPGRFLQWAAGARFLFPNLDEGRILSGMVDPDDVVEALVERFPVVALKLGGGGALVATAPGDRLRCLPPPGEVVDTTGAGDAFAAGFLAAWLGGQPTRACADRALVAAATALARVGGRPEPPGAGGQPDGPLSNL